MPPIVNGWLNEIRGLPYYLQPGYEPIDWYAKWQSQQVEGGNKSPIEPQRTNKSPIQPQQTRMPEAFGLSGLMTAEASHPAVTLVATTAQGHMPDLPAIKSVHWEKQEEGEEEMRVSHIKSFVSKIPRSNSPRHMRPKLQPLVNIIHSIVQCIPPEQKKLEFNLSLCTTVDP